jgi:hypothetical protein
VPRLAIAAALLVVGAVASAQSLGDVARREQEKKEKKQTPASPAPTYTEADLKAKRTKSKGTVSELPATGGPRTGTSPEATPSPDSSPAPDASPSPEPEPDRAALEREWRIRFAQARTRIAEAEAAAFEERIEVVFVSGIPVQQRVRVKVDTKELLDARQALADLEEELRRSGGLPGWAR